MAKTRNKEIDDYARRLLDNHDPETAVRIAVSKFFDARDLADKYFQELKTEYSQ